MAKKKGNTGKRYSEQQKKTILDYVKKQGRGGISSACKKFGVSYIALRRWMNGATGGGAKRGPGRPEKSKGLDGRKLRSVKSAIGALKAITKQVKTLQKTLGQIVG